MYSVEDQLKQLELTDSFKEFVISMRGQWAHFGMYDSHFHRKILMKKMAAAGLDGDQKFIVFVLFSIHMTRNKVLEAMEAMTSGQQAQPWFKPVKRFVTTRVTDRHVPEVTKSEVFPALKIIACVPGLDLLIYGTMTQPNERSMVEFFRRPTASRLKLDKDTQDMAKEGYKFYWETIVPSRGPGAKDSGNKKPVFKEERYLNVAKDDYKLIDSRFKEIPPKDETKGYSADEIEEYLFSLDPINKDSVSEAKLTGEASKFMTAGDASNETGSASSSAPVTNPSA